MFMTYLRFQRIYILPPHPLDYKQIRGHYVPHSSRVRGCNAYIKLVSTRLKQRRIRRNELSCSVASLFGDVTTHVALFPRRPRIQMEESQRWVFPGKRKDAATRLSAGVCPTNPLTFPVTWERPGEKQQQQQQHKFINASTNETSHRKVFLVSMPPLWTALPGSGKRPVTKTGKTHHSNKNVCDPPF